MIHFLWRNMVWLWSHQDKKKEEKRWFLSFYATFKTQRWRQSQLDCWLVDFLFTLTQAPLPLALETITPHCRGTVLQRRTERISFTFTGIFTSDLHGLWPIPRLWRKTRICDIEYSSKVNNWSKWADQTFFYQRNLWLLQLPMVVSKFVIMIQRILKVCRSEIN